MAVRQVISLGTGQFAALALALGVFSCRGEPSSSLPAAGQGAPSSLSAAGQGAPSSLPAAGQGAPTTPAPAVERGEAGAAGQGLGASGGSASSPNAGTEPLPGSVGGSGGVAAAGAAVGFFPANGAKDVCPDPPLRLHFSGPPRFGSSGKIRVFDAMAPGDPVAVVDLAVGVVDQMIGGTAFKVPRPVHVDGNDAIVRLPARALRYGRNYFVTLDDGSIIGPGGSSLSIVDPAAWQFSTVGAAPTELSSLRVALDGTGQFCSIQAALDALPARNTAASLITVEPGTYFEIIRVASKNNFSLRGRDRHGTRVVGVNNNDINPSTATRSLVGIDASSGVVIENLTIHNLTPQGGSQAEALRMQSCDRCVVRHADILGLQDTLLWSGRIYASDCYIEGNVDFVWGTGAALFDHCEIKTVGRAGWVVQARNGSSGGGYVFVASKITAEPGITGSHLGRIDVSQYPASQVAYIDCQLGSHIAPSGWTISGGSATPSLQFWEYRSTDAAGAPLDVSQRIAGSQQISAEQAQKLRDPAQLLGGWTPPD